MILSLLRFLFVFPFRVQKWIDRLLILAGVLMFLWRLWQRVRDRKPKERKVPAVPVLPPPAWDRADDLPDVPERMV